MKNTLINVEKDSTSTKSLKRKAKSVSSSSLGDGENEGGGEVKQENEQIRRKSSRLSKSINNEENQPEPLLELPNHFSMFSFYHFLLIFFDYTV